MVPPGLKIQAGPSDVARAIAELVENRNIDYSGVTGELDFNVATGESPGDYNLYCVKGSDFAANGQYYLAGEGRLVGTYQPCP